MEAEQLDHLHEEIERCREWLQAALDHGGNSHDVEHIEEGIRCNQFQAWFAEDAVLVTELIDYPNYRVVHVFLAGGSLETILQMRPDIERFGQHFGCKYLSINGRPGWARALKEFGYDRGLQTVSKHLDTIEPEEGV